MRVLHVTSSFPRSLDDPVAPFLLDLARAQRAAGIDAVVLAPHDAGAAVGEVLDGVPVHRFRYAPDRAEVLAYRGGLLGRTRSPAAAGLPAFLAAMAAGTARHARTLRPDVVHAHWWLPAGLTALPAARRLGLPLVVTLHGSDAHLLRRRGLRALGGGVLRRADLVGVVSEDLRRAVLASTALVPERVAVLRLPVTRPDAAPEPLPPLPVRLLAAGRLSPEKGFDVLLEAFAAAVADGFDARLVLVGSGPERPRLAALADRVPGRVRLLPALPREALFAEMAAAHALVVPSRREGLGLVALEALLRGRPVVASRAGGLPEVVSGGEDGLLVPPGDVPALAAALRRLPLPPPVARAADRHDPGAVARAHRDAYAGVLTARPGGAGP